MSSSINIKKLKLIFRKYHNDIPTLKEHFIKNHLRKDQTHNQFVALNNISLKLNSGDRIGIVGKNGAGKSTLLKAIAGIYPPSEGSIEICGKVVPLLELGAGFDMNRTTLENIYLNGAILGLSKYQVKRLQNHIIEFSELKSFINMPLKSLSSGMRGRLSFSIATSLSPEILILDEVFATGDASFVEKARKRMIGVIDSADILILVSHREKLIKDLCNKVIVLHEGKIKFQGKPNDAIRYYQNKIIDVT
jgi:ABC-type polysaccharide/polyol phosphate transport system ATPase subunit